MLILSRKNGQSIKIGKDIYVTIYTDGSSQVRVGIDAPRAVNVVRTEIINSGKDAA